MRTAASPRSGNGSAPSGPHASWAATYARLNGPRDGQPASAVARISCTTGTHVIVSPPPASRDSTSGIPTVSPVGLAAPQPARRETRRILQRVRAEHQPAEFDGAREDQVERQRDERELDERGPTLRTPGATLSRSLESLDQTTPRGSSVASPKGVVAPRAA